MKLEFYPQIFEKYSNIKILESAFRGSRVIARGQIEKGRTERHDEVNSLFSQFCGST